MARRYFTTEEDEYLKSVFSKLPTKVIAENLGRTRGSIAGRASALGLKKEDNKDIENGVKKCPHCSKVLPIEDFKYKNKGRISEGKLCNECRKKDKYQKAVKRKLEQLKEKAGILSTKEMEEREEKKNKQTFICSICGKELPGVEFGFRNKRSLDIDFRCRKCRSERTTKNKMKNINDGKCW